MCLSRLEQVDLTDPSTPPGKAHLVCGLNLRLAGELPCLGLAQAIFDVLLLPALPGDEKTNRLVDEVTAVTHQFHREFIELIAVFAVNSS